jgi:DnaJ like chaperone protein
MSYLIFTAVVFVFYMLTRDYDPSQYEKININKKQVLKGDLGEHEAGLLIGMMAKVAKADGQVCELESEILSHTFTDLASHFQNNEQIRDELKKIYNKEKSSFDNTIDLASKYLRLTQSDYHKRLKVLEYLLNLAFIDGDFSQAEFLITEDIANSMKIKKSDFEALVSQFRQYYEQQAQTKQNDIEESYKILGANKSDDFSTIKKKYRALVKEHHPDIITGSGASQSIIDQATRKLQSINQAYGEVKKHLKNNG